MLQQIQSAAGNPLIGEVDDEVLGEVTSLINQLDTNLGHQATRAFLEFAPLSKLPQHYAKLNSAHIDLLIGQPQQKMEKCLLARSHRLSVAEVAKVKSSVKTEDLAQMSSELLESLFAIEADSDAELRQSTCYFADTLSSRPGVVLYESGNSIEVRGVPSIASATPLQQLLVGQCYSEHVVLNGPRFLGCTDDLKTLVSSVVNEYLSNNNLKLDTWASRIELLPATLAVRTQVPEASVPEMLF